ncbi:MAG: sugar phosphate isomerase/epimerase [Burkholderiales bacterium]|nr:sugar phosphate isomerase/epimerase [Phycisphaerae bacterium]
MLPQARQAGFDGVQLDDASRSPHLASLSSSGRREVRNLLHTYNLQLTGIRVDLGADGLGPTVDVDQALDRIDRTFAAAAELACPLVCIDLGRLPPAQRIVKPKPKVTAQMLGVLILPDPIQATEPDPEPHAPTTINPAITSHWQQAMGQLGEIADRYGAMLALSSALSSFAALSSLLKQIDCPWFGVDLDCSGILRDEWSMDEIFDTLGQQVRHVRARDAVKGEDRRTKPAIIGRGDVRWRDLLSHLDSAGYHGAVTIDSGELSDSQSGAVAGLKQLKVFLE